MTTTSDILDKLGRKQVADAMGVKIAAVGNAAALNQFPASWFLTLSEMCREAEIECPPRLFAMKGSAARTDAA